MCPQATTSWRLRQAALRPTWHPKVTLLVKTPATVNIQLQLEGVKTLVEVEGEAPLINRTDASLGNTVEEDQIAELPIADRNVAYLLSLQPGVAYLGEPPRRIEIRTRGAAR